MAVGTMQECKAITPSLSVTHVLDHAMPCQSPSGARLTSSIMPSLGQCLWHVTRRDVRDAATLPGVLS